MSSTNSITLAIRQHFERNALDRWVSYVDARLQMRQEMIDLWL